MRIKRLEGLNISESENLLSLRVPDSAEHLPNLKGKSLHVVKISSESENQNVWGRFIGSVAKGYQRYSAGELKSGNLEGKTDAESTHLALIDEDGEVYGTLSVQHPQNGSGTELADLFGKSPETVHQNLVDAWPNGYVEAKNLTALENLPYRTRKRREQMGVVLNMLVLASARHLQSEGYKIDGDVGLVEVMATHVTDFVTKHGELEPELMDLQPNIENLRDMAVQFYTYFLNGSTFENYGEIENNPNAVISETQVLEIYKRHSAEINQEDFDEDSKISNSEEFKIKAMQDPNGISGQVVKKYLEAIIFKTDTVPPEWHIEDDKFRTSIAPRTYVNNIWQLANEAQENIQKMILPENALDSVISAIEAKNQPLNIDVLTSPTAELVDPDELAELLLKGIIPQIIPIPDSNFNLKEDGHKYIKIYTKPAETETGIPLTREQLIYIKIPDSVNPRLFTREDARKALLSHALSRAIPYIFFEDFDPEINKDLPIETRIWNYLQLKDSHADRLANMRVGIAGQGTVGLAPLKGLSMHGIGTIRVSDDPNEPIDEHNIERIEGATRGVDDGRSKLAFARRLIQQMANPMTNLEIIPSKIESQRDADLFVANQDIVVSAVDDTQAMFYLHTAAKKRGIPLILATDIAEGTKVQVFDYRNHETELFNGLVKGELLSALENNEATDEHLGQLIFSLIGGTKKRVNIPYVDMFFFLPVQSLKFFIHKLEGSLPNLAQDGISAKMTGILIETIIHEYGNSGNLPVFDQIITPKTKLGIKGMNRPERIKRRMQLIKRLMKAAKSEEQPSAA